MIESPQLIGRDEEMAALDELVERGRPGLVLLVGGPGTGKSVVLRELRTRAATSPCRVVPVSDEDGAPFLVVARRSTADDLLQAISASSEDGRENAGTDTWQPQRRQALDLVLIHGYRPADDFHEWFTREFIQGVGDSAPRLVVVAGSPGDLAALEPLAYAKVVVGPLQRDAVVAELRTIDVTINDRLDEREIDLYADAIKTDPALLETLRQVLPLTSAPGPERETPKGKSDGIDTGD